MPMLVNLLFDQLTIYRRSLNALLLLGLHDFASLLLSKTEKTVRLILI